MINTETLTDELSFLKWINGETPSQYKTSQWVTTHFDASVWMFVFDSRRKFSVDFRVRIDDGSLLTEESNRSLLETLKSWICIQTHLDITGGIIYSAISAYIIVRKVLLLIDYFLINSDYFKLSHYGLTNVTENDIVNLLTKLASSNEITSSIYEWPSRLTNFLRSELARNETANLIEIIQKNPFLAREIPDEDEWLLGLTTQEIIYSRAFLWKDGYYKYRYTDTKNIAIHRHGANTLKLSQTIFANTLVGINQKPQPSELLLSPLDNYRKEFSRAPIKNASIDQIAEKSWGGYRKAIRTLGQLAEIGAPVPIFALKATNSLFLQKNFRLKPCGRFRTIPHDIVLQSFRKAVEFALNYGPDLLESVIATICASRSSNMNCIAYSAENDIRPLLTSKIRAIGVKVWHLGYHMNSSSRHLTSNIARPPSSEYFIRLRNNEGLHELLRVFYGAVQICLGALMARRQAEFLDLISGSALDKGKTFLVFYNRKSGVGDMRSKEARPIPPVGVKLVELLEKFHDRLVEIGVSPKQQQLFSYPECYFGTTINLLSGNYNANLDIACDYLETSLNEIGERYYIRQHQLRRFFAMMFFWGGSFGGMEALRWFLGHTDIEHLYHYITESTPGDVLQSTKAQFGIEILKSNPQEAPIFADIVEKHFGTCEFSVLDSNELDEFVEELMIEGRLKIEPEFFEGPEGKTYRIAIRVMAETGNTVDG